MKIPTEKDLLAPTFHSDGTVSYWDADRQRWMRRAAPDVPSEALEGFTPRERRIFETGGVTRATRAALEHFTVEDNIGAY